MKDFKQNPSGVVRHTFHKSWDEPRQATTSRRCTDPSRRVALLKALCLSTVLAWSPSIWAQDAAPEASSTDQAADEQAEAAEEGSASFDEDKFFDLVSQGQTKFKAQDYEAAAELFKQAYAMKPDATLLFNIGIAFEKHGNLEEALAYYDRFVDAPNVELKARSHANKRSKLIREILDDRAQAKKAEEAEKAEAEARAGREAAASREQAESQPEQQQAGVGQQTQALPEPQYDYTMTWITLGSGTVAAIGGGVFMAMAHSSGDDVLDGATPEARRASQSDANTYAIISDSLFITGGLLAATGVYFWLTAEPIEQDTRATIAPQLGPDRAGVQMQLKF
ncbi:tetratricopeptide repeat protein [Persicimonas caeni]|uniref:tetratricopeptide repeat protein n=1 Tax=Persicimonas caeni TaxID=2292766 RepID=UPI00143D0FAF|nr:tetratricopeptide repeat protein [Persicimonas caeni]